MSYYSDSKRPLTEGLSGDTYVAMPAVNPNPYTSGTVVADNGSFSAGDGMLRRSLAPVAPGWGYGYFGPRRRLLIVASISCLFVVTSVVLIVTTFHMRNHNNNNPPSPPPSSVIPPFTFSGTQTVPCLPTYKFVQFNTSDWSLIQEGMKKIYDGAAANYAASQSNGASFSASYGDQVMYAGSYGNVSIGMPGALGPPNGDTVYRIGSVSKLFASMLMYMLRDLGLVQLHDPVTKYLPSFVIKSPYNFTAPITLGLLAGQISGLPRETPCSLFCPGSNVFCSEAECSESQILSAIASDYTLLFPPGSNAHYSNLGLALLGRALEKAVGTKYEDLVTTNILEPLGMTSTGFSGTDPAVQERLAWNSFGIDAGWAAPCGQMYSTLNDLTKFAQFLLRYNAPSSGSQPLSGESLTESQLLGFGNPNGLTGFGRGTYEMNLIDSHWAPTKGGDMPPFSAQITLFPWLNVALVGLGSYQGASQPITYLAGSSIVRGFEAKLAASQPPPLVPANIHQYVGTYANSDKTFEVAISLDSTGQLSFTMIGLPKRLIWTGQGGNFRMETVGPYIDSPSCMVQGQNICPISCILKEFVGDGEIVSFFDDAKSPYGLGVSMVGGGISTLLKIS